MLRAAVLAVMVLLVACPSVSQPVRRPRARLAQLAIAGHRPGILELRLRLSLANQDSRPLSFEAVDWAVALDGGIARRGRSALAVRLAAGERRDVVVALAVRVPEGLVAARAYHLVATVHGRGPAGGSAVVVDEQGDFAR
jgi:hypothetical protein